MLKFNSKLNIALIATVFIFAANTAYAGYDVIRARTVGSLQNKDNTSDEIIIPTANDPELPDFSEDKTVASYFKNRKPWFFKRKNKEIIQDEAVVQEAEEKQPKQTQEVVKDQNKFQVNADKMTYDDTDGNVYANGHVEIIANAQGVTLKADEAVLDKASQTIKLKNNVSIIKDGMEMTGETLVVDLNEENVIMDNPVAECYSFLINAQESYIVANNLQMLNGTVSSATKKQIPFIPKRFYGYVPGSMDELYDPNIQNELDTDKSKKAYRIDAKEIVMTSYKDHNSMVLKGSNVYYNNHKIFPKTDIEILSDKPYQVIETNMPEIGTLKSFGSYVGYGFVRKLPKGQVLKIMPAVVYGEGDLGVGLIGRHRSRNSTLEAGYSTSTEKFVARGLYKFGNGFSLRYGRNAYLPEGFMGTRRSAYAAQLAFEKSYTERDTDINFRHSTYAGIFADYKKHGKHYFSTTRFRHNLELSKKIFEYKNSEQDLKIRLSLVAQGSATLYGTGDTVGVFRFGPTLASKLKKWESSISYFQAGIHGDSPFVFDKYRYGRCSILFNEKFNFNNKFAIGYSTTISPNKDNYERDMITESRIYALLGPKDFKIALSYDFVRDIGHLDFMFILGTDSTKINFEKLTTDNIDNAKQKKDFYKKAKTIKVEDI